jgi:hypothetical protein
MVTRMIINAPIPDESEDTSAFWDTFIKVVSKGSTIGKLRIAMSEKLLLALEAMAAIMVRIDASPKLPRINAVKNRGIFTTRLPINVRNKTNDKDDRMAIKSRLYNTFDSNTAWGLAMV